jgi:hypothetical protein
MERHSRGITYCYGRPYFPRPSDASTKQFPIEFSELRHISYVIGESGHYLPRQRVSLLWGLARRLH